MRLDSWFTRLTRLAFFLSLKHTKPSALSGLYFFCSLHLEAFFHLILSSFPSFSDFSSNSTFSVRLSVTYPTKQYFSLTIFPSQHLTLSKSIYLFTCLLSVTSIFCKLYPEINSIIVNVIYPKHKVKLQKNIKLFIKYLHCLYKLYYCYFETIRYFCRIKQSIMLR